MHYEFVDIGTSDFDYSCFRGDVKILLVEPLQIYLDRIPDNKNQIKANFAISDFCGQGQISYIHPDDIEKYNLSYYLRGCNSFNNPHVTAINELKSNDLMHLYRNKTVNVITVDRLLELYDISNIGFLKIDTEGHDHIILEQFYKKIIDGFYVPHIKFEYFSFDYFGNKAELDLLVEKFRELNYDCTRSGSDNMALTLRITS